MYPEHPLRDVNSTCVNRTCVIVHTLFIVMLLTKFCGPIYITEFSKVSVPR